MDTYCPKSRTDWRKWLEINHQSKQSVWLVYFKTSTNVPSLSWSEAVDEALCFGWIDSTKKTIDEERYVQYFSRRNPNSTWSLMDDVEKLFIPEDLRIALNKNESSMEFFQGQSKSIKKAMLH